MTAPLLGQFKHRSTCTIKRIAKPLCGDVADIQEGVYVERAVEFIDTPYDPENPLNLKSGWEIDTKIQEQH